MWAQRLAGPGRLELVEAPEVRPDELVDGQVLVKLRAAGICGSDVPKFEGHPDPDNPYAGAYGFPIHEVVGEIMAVKGADLRPGQRVVGFAEQTKGLREYFTTAARLVHALRSDELDDAHATVIQPVCTVLNAVERLPAFAGKRIAVIGLGSIGVIFTHVLKSRGAGTVVGIDPVDRADVAGLFGIDRVVAATSRDWAASLADAERPEIIVEVVGHQQQTVADAIEAVAPHGTIFAFGLPIENEYTLPFKRIFRKQLTLRSGTTQDWRRFLAEAEEYVLAHRDVFQAYVTDILPFEEAQKGFELACHPAPGRLKVALAAKA